MNPSYVVFAQISQWNCFIQFVCRKKYPFHFVPPKKICCSKCFCHIQFLICMQMCVLIHIIFVLLCYLFIFLSVAQTKWGLFPAIFAESHFHIQSSLSPPIKNYRKYSSISSLFSLFILLLLCVSEKVLVQTMANFKNWRYKF